MCGTWHKKGGGEAATGCFRAWIARRVSVIICSAGRRCVYLQEKKIHHQYVSKHNNKVDLHGALRLTLRGWITSCPVTHVTGNLLYRIQPGTTTDFKMYN